MDESSITCDTVVITVQSILTPTQFAIFGENPKVGGLQYSASYQMANMWGVKVNISISSLQLLSLQVDL